MEIFELILQHPQYFFGTVFIVATSIYLKIKDKNPKTGGLYQFQKNISETKGLFLDVKTKKEYIFEFKDFVFKEERFYTYEPKKILDSFGYLGSPTVYNQTWKREAHP